MAARIDSKQSEKQYLSRSGGHEWERLKPFPPAGTEMFDQSVELLGDFSVAMRLLQPAPDDRILDLGAGAGWCSDLLQRLNRKTVAVDIAHEMLAVTRARSTRAPIPAVAGDMERLPFRDGAFDKAVCLSALHHVPDMRAAVREIARVLSPTGVAVFSEPGVGHADRPVSVKATRDFGVLEQEVLIDAFTDMCLEAGFRHAMVCPIAYVIPEFELSDEEWRAWRRLATSKRPVRALGKMWRAMLEFVGAGKKDVLFEEALAMRLVRLLRMTVEEHPFFIAAKSDERRRGRPNYRARIDSAAVPDSIGAHQPGSAVVRLTNAGTTTWRAGTSVGCVRAGMQLLDSASSVIDRDFARGDLPHDVPAGGTVTVTIAFTAPGETGLFQLKIDLVAEGIAWFEPGGSAVVIHDLTVGRGVSG